MWLLLAFSVFALFTLLGALAKGATAMSRYEDRADRRPYRRAA